MTFFFYMAGLGLVVLILATVIGPVLLSDRRGQDADVYRDQLAALEKDRARGIVTNAEHDALRAEIARRLLNAAGQSPLEAQAGQRKRMTLAAVALAIVSGGAVYWAVGSPDNPDAPLALRIEQAEMAQTNLPPQEDLDAARPEFEAIGVTDDYRARMDELRTILADRPDDLVGLNLLARGESRLGNFPAAHQAQRKILDLRADLATAEDWGLYTEFLLLAADEWFTTQSRAALLETLRRNPQSGLARYRLGQLHLQTGRTDLTFSIWAGLLDEGPEAAPYIPPIRAQIDQVAAAAGFPNYEQPRPRGPDLDAISDAEDMTPEDRNAMIEGMVSGLADRLANEGGPASDWAQLIRAFGVLGRQDQAGAVYDEARTVFAGRPADLRLLDDAAEQAGVAQ